MKLSKNKYTKLLAKILDNGVWQMNSKGNSQQLINVMVKYSEKDIRDIFHWYNINRNRLEGELELYLLGVVNVDVYKANGIHWWDYIGDNFYNSYPQHFVNLPPVIEDINHAIRESVLKDEYTQGSRNWFLNLNTNGKSNQHACISYIQFQILEDLLYITVYQRSADANLGLPADLFQIFLISKKIEIPLGNITFIYGNVHIYENNITKTVGLLIGEAQPKFNQNI